MSVPSTLMKSMGRCASRRCGSRPVPKCSMAKRKPALRRPLASSVVSARYSVAICSLIWNARRLGFDARGFELVRQPLQQRLVAHRIFRQAHEQLFHRAAGAERHRRADHPAIDVFHQVVAFGGGHEFGGQQFFALLIDHAHQHVEHAFVFAEQAGDGLLHQSEAVFHQRRSHALHPQLVGRFALRILFAVIDDLQPSAAVEFGRLRERRAHRSGRR